MLEDMCSQPKQWKPLRQAVELESARSFGRLQAGSSGGYVLAHVLSVSLLFARVRKSSG